MRSWGPPVGLGCFAHSGGWLDQAECTGCVLFPDPLPIPLQVFYEITPQVDICTQILVLVSTSGAAQTKTVVSTEFL